MKNMKIKIRNDLSDRLGLLFIDFPKPGFADSTAAEMMGFFFKP